MKIIDTETYEDVRAVHTRYRYDSIFSGLDAKALLDQFASLGVLISGITVYYSTEDYGSCAPTEADSIEDLEKRSNQVCWKYVESIQFLGSDDAECFHGEIVPLDTGGYYSKSVVKQQS